MTRMEFLGAAIAGGFCGTATAFLIGILVAVYLYRTYLQGLIDGYDANHPCPLCERRKQKAPHSTEKI
jgi:hypothetical protein